MSTDTSLEKQDSNITTHMRQIRIRVKQFGQLVLKRRKQGTTLQHVHNR